MLVTLSVNGRQYGGWKRVRITRGIECLCGSFELETTDRWAGRGQSWPIKQGDECTVAIGSNKVITGYVDRREMSLSADDHSIAIAGRDWPGQLVDCSAIVDPSFLPDTQEVLAPLVRGRSAWEFKNTDLLTLVKRLLLTFGKEQSVHLAPLVVLPQIKKLAISPGDSSHEVIERACRMTGVLAMSDGQGGLFLTPPGWGYATTAIVEGKNALAISASHDATGRYRYYVVLGQAPSHEDNPGKSVRAVAEDKGVSRAGRTLIVRAENAVNTAQCKARAEWEATVRAARSCTYSVRLVGWQQADGSLWQPNHFVNVHAPSVEIEHQQMLISQVVYSLDENGEVVDLTLRRPDAFKPEPFVEATPHGSTVYSELAGGV